MSESTANAALLAMPPAMPPAMPHGPLREIAPDLYLAPSTFDLAPLMRISRNMVVVRSGEDITLINPVRLSPQGEAELEALGTVRHAVRLGVFHGVDDPYTVARFGAEFWCQAGSTRHRQPAPDHELTEGGELPLPDARLFVFRETKKPECALLLRRGDGVLLTCDALQHYGTYERHSLVARLTMPLLGFRKTLMIGPLWLKYMTPEGGSLRPDYERLLELPFDALIAAHGTPLMRGAHPAARAAVARAFPRA